MATDPKDEVVVANGGPGSRFVSKRWVVFLVFAFVAFAVGLSIALWRLWPICSTGAPAVQEQSGSATQPPSDPAANTASISLAAQPGTAPTSETPGSNRGAEPAGEAETIKVDLVSPNSGDSAGGTRVSIAGDGFQKGTSVKFGGVPAVEVALVSPQRLLATTPAHYPGSVDVWVSMAEKVGVPHLQAYTYVDCVSARDVLLLVLLAGALGGTLHSIRSLSWYVGNRYLRRSWIPTYVCYPFAGSALACIFFLCLQGGILPNDNPSERLWIVGVSALIGLFTREAFEKLKTIAEAIFSVAQSGADKPKTAPADSTFVPVDPRTGPIAGNETVRVSGSGFILGTTVQFGSVAAVSVSIESPTTLVVVTPAVSQPGPVDVIIETPGTPPKTTTYAKGYTYV